MMKLIKNFDKKREREKKNLQVKKSQIKKVTKCLRKLNKIINMQDLSSSEYFLDFPIQKNDMNIFNILIILKNGFENLYYA